MIYSGEEQNLIVLAAMTDMTYGEKAAALSSLQNSVPDFEACKNSLIKRRDIGVYNKVRENFFNSAFRDKLFAGLENRGVKCVTYFSADYPELLKHIPSPPIALFLKGKTELLNSDCFTIVGSRRTPTGMLAQCKRFAKELSERFTVTSGEATGADSAALAGADFKAISVLPYGFDHIKGGAGGPIKRVEREGLIISEYFPTTPSSRYFFHPRNRILAGLSKGVLVVSAGNRSGALITANYALDFGREVFAFPYSIGIEQGVGCNNLIKEGANICQNPLDIFSAFGLDLKPSLKVQLTFEEQKVLNALKEQGEGMITTLSQKLDVPPHKLIATLSMLEIKGLIVRLGGNRYSII